MFDLEIALGKWRKELLAAGLRDFAIISELEGHLRDDVAEQIRRGISPEVAFEAALQRIGKPDQLKTEFALADRASWMSTFRQHKWKLVLCTALGLLCAGVLYVVRPPIYQSEAMLLVRHIIKPDVTLPVGPQIREASTLPAEDQDRSALMMDLQRQILKSWDLARIVAQAVGPKKLLASSEEPNDLARATAVIHNGLIIEIAPKSIVMRLTFQHADGSVVQAVLREIIDHYLRIHVETHRNAGHLFEGLGKISNISAIQTPSPAFKLHKFDAAIAISVGVGFLAGLVWLLAIKLSSGGPDADLRATN